MKKSQKILLFIVLPIILIACVGVAAFFIFDEIDQKNKFTTSNNSLSETNINTDITTKGMYGVVEGIVKNDFKTYMESADILTANYTEFASLQPLNIEVLKTDGPDFANTRPAVQAIKDENIAASNALKAIVSEEEMNKKIADNGLTDKFATLYKDVESNMKLKEGVDTIIAADTKFDEFLASVLEVLDYLTANKDKWFIEDDVLKSTDQTFIDEYNALITKTNSITIE